MPYMPRLCPMFMERFELQEVDEPKPNPPREEDVLGYCLYEVSMVQCACIGVAGGLDFIIMPLLPTLLHMLAMLVLLLQVLPDQLK